MTSNLQQIQLNYNQIQDRMTLSIISQDMSEYQFWITRRATSMLWSVLLKLLQADQKTDLEKMIEGKAIAKQILEERSRRRPEAQQFTNTVTKKPLGEEPMLLFGLKAIPSKEGESSITLIFEDEKGQSLKLAGTSSIILALCQLLQQTLLLTDWGIDLKIPSESVEKKQKKKETL